jgi:hypothetical protein
MNWTGYLKQARADKAKKNAAAARKADREKNYMVENDHIAPITTKKLKQNTDGH